MTPTMFVNPTQREDATVVVTYEDHIAECSRAYEVGGNDYYYEGFHSGLIAAMRAVAATENIGGYPPSHFDHIKDDALDAIGALREGEK